MADKTILNGRKLKPVLDEFRVVALHPMENRIDVTPATKRPLFNVGMYFIAPMLALVFLILCKLPRWSSGHWSSPIMPCSNTLTDFLLEQFSVAIAYVDPDIAGNRVGQIITQLFSLHWPGDDKSILQIVTSIIDMTIFAFVNAALTGVPDTSAKIRYRWGFQKESNGDSGQHACNVTPNIDNNTAAGWVQVAMQWINPMLFCVTYPGQQANSTSGAQRPMHGGRCNLPLDDIHQPPAEDMIDHITVELDDYAEMQCPNPRISLTKITGFQQFDRKVERRNSWQHRYLEVIWNWAIGLFADYQQIVVADEDVP